MTTISNYVALLPWTVVRLWSREDKIFSQMKCLYLLLHFCVDRSGLVAGSSGQFCADLVSWAQELGLEQLVCLTSSLAHERQECQLTGAATVMSEPMLKHLLVRNQLQIRGHGWS